MLVQDLFRVEVKHLLLCIRKLQSPDFSLCTPFTSPKSIFDSRFCAHRGPAVYYQLNLKS